MIDSLSAISVFVKVAQVGSFVSAGRALGLSASAVGKRVTSLESNVGAQLLQRNTRKISLTYEGERFLSHALRILEEVDHIQNAMLASTESPVGRLKISVAPIPHLFSERFNDFLEQHREIEVEFDFSDRFVDLVGENYDAALRVGNDPDGNLRSYYIGDIHSVLVASPGYLTRCGYPEKTDDLLSHALIHYRSRNSGMIQAWPLPNIKSLHLPQTIICNDIDTRIDLALNGNGIAYLPLVSIKHHLRSGQLCEVLSEHLIDAGAPLYVVWPYAHRYSMRQRLLIDYLKQMKI
ncbi:LysR family transcriptional regulator [Chimaeribacter californicus]|uniref:LysR family transcriptional regulator n=1 Tax=Chimaeribacter californicus TaxID=2060067 RepID=A0A2N5DZK7_9GAMM|nr:LysR family transcriptional regulator [Chimaeribacter californicus]PLR33283.1 LysR family transcriptional regulator [Chimaeribacter californicus]